jgi:protein-tyrosine sulfotransferase
MKRKVGITGFNNLNSYKECLIAWNKLIDDMYAQCVYVGKNSCLPVHYERLILHPEIEMRKILDFLNMNWNDAVLHHEQFIGKKIRLSKVEISTDQIVKPINLEALYSWVGNIPSKLSINQLFFFL